jgi:serine protease Do
MDPPSISGALSTTRASLSVRLCNRLGRHCQVWHTGGVKRVLSIFALGAVIATAPQLSAQTPPASQTPPAPAKSQPSSLREISASFEELASRVRPAVVQIFSTGYARAEPSEDSSNAALFTKQTSTGSGVILTADGYIVTNNHVVENARRIEVRLPPRASLREPTMTLSAKVVGTDRETDLAVLKIEGKNLATLALGDSGQLRQGELVMAFGNPFGLEGSASTGVVSSTSRQLKPDDPMAYIQTDAPINPGNSGGPLVDAEGRVVGINTLIFTRSGGSEGIGFAVPSNVVRNVYNQIRKDGHVHRGHIGVGLQSITATLAKGLGLPQDWGVVVSDIEPDGPAKAAGVQIGDVIQALNGKPVESASRLENEIYGLPLTDSVKLTLLRDGKTVSVTVPVHEQEDDPTRFADMVNPEDNLVPKLGILAIELDEKIADMLPDLRHDYGLVVAARMANPPYSGGELETGDVIYELNTTPTLSVKGVRAALDQLKPGDAVVLQVERNGHLMYLGLELE